MASSSGSSTPQSKFEVFLSFRGEDTRDNFTSHLYSALCRKQIKTFIDNELHRGEEISPTLLKFIEESMVSVIIFSENYAHSPWCLDELVKILECRKVADQVVLPVFYRVNPMDVAEQKGAFGDAFVKLEEGFKESIHKVQKWRAALNGAASLSGWDSLVIRPESKLIEEIVLDILKKLNHKSSCDFRGLVGIYSRIQRIESLLGIGSMDICVLGIWGMGGIGKTTIAGAVFDKISRQFDGYYFLANVREQSEKYGLYQLQRQLFLKVLGEENLDIDAYDIGTSFIRRRLQRMKVLLVLDDVDNFRQIEFLAGEREWYGPGSKIIITTRDKDVLKSVVNEIYEVEGLDYHEALQLFNLNAFKQDQLRQDQLKLSETIISYANGNPLALKVLGSFLHCRGTQEWKSALQKLERNPNLEIQNILRISYDGLDVEEKDVFLDIACFFKGEDKNFAERILNGCGFSFDIVTSVLIDKSLVTISNNKLEMHNLLQRMGWEIVRQESIKEPGKRSRLWTAEDVFHILKKNTGTETIEGIFFDMSKMGDILLNPKAFSRMDNLRLLKFYDSSTFYWLNSRVYLQQSPEFLPDKLSYLQWDACPLRSLPLNFCAEELVELKMPYSQVESLWEGNQNLEKLNIIDLSHSQNFIRLPDLSQALNLECINLEGCISLLQVPSSIKCFKKLTVLNLKNCRELTSIPSCIYLQSLHRLNLSGCSKLKNLPEISRCVEELSLDGTAIEELPASIEHLSELYFWSMRNCKLLKGLPSNICSMKYLTSLLISGCLKLESIPVSIRKLSQLQKLDISGCERLTSLPELPPNLRLLNAKGCISLETISSSATLFKEKMLPKCPNNQRYCYINCPRLNQNSLHIIEDASQWSIQHTAAAAVRDYYQGLHSLPSICFSYPANEIPNWFGCRKKGSHITIKLPSNWRNPKFLGFAVCAVVECTVSADVNDIYVVCECNLTTNHGDHHVVSCTLRGLANTSDELGPCFVRSNHVFVGYDFSLYLRAIEENGQEKSCYYSEATFTFYSRKEYGHSYTLRVVGTCVVHLLYAQDEGAQISAVDQLLSPRIPFHSYKYLLWR